MPRVNPANDAARLTRPATRASGRQTVRFEPSLLDSLTMTTAPANSPHARPGRPNSSLFRLRREWAAQDWLVLVYFCVLWCCAFAAEPDARRDRCLLGIGVLGALFVGGVVAIRLRWVTGSLAAPLTYRISVYGSVQTSYFLLRDLLPIVNPTRTLDSSLYALDVALFGFEPAVPMEAWISPLATEWFSFFYFSYFCLLAFHIFPILGTARNAQLLGEFCFGMLWLYCAGHIIYLMVPGYGPIVALADDFTTEFPRGLWYDMVMGTVSSAGAQMDVVPSLHTAAPVFLTLFSYRHRDRIPFRYTWPVLCFFTANIVLATMYLRWHWIIDIAAGIAHGAVALALAQFLTQRELPRRRALALTPNWPLFGATAKSRDSRPSSRPGDLKAA